jgi:prepilin peptidase CpaA
MNPATQISPVNNPLFNAVPLPSLLVLGIVLVVAVYTEVKENRIPNWLTLSGMLAGLLIGYLDNQFVFWSSLIGLVIGSGFLFLFYIFGGVGGGDVKLMGAVGSLMGGHLIQMALFYTAMIWAFMAVMLLIWRRDSWLRMERGLRGLAFWRKPSPEQNPPSSPLTIPYGVAIAAGCLLALFIQGAQ